MLRYSLWGLSWCAVLCTCGASVLAQEQIGGAPGELGARTSYNQTRQVLPVPSLPTPSLNLLPSLPHKQTSALGQINEGAREIVGGAFDLLTPWRNNRIKTVDAPPLPTGTRRVYPGGASQSKQASGNIFDAPLLSIFGREENRTEDRNSQVNGFLNQPRVGFK